MTAGENEGPPNHFGEVAGELTPVVDPRSNRVRASSVGAAASPLCRACDTCVVRREVEDLERLVVAESPSRDADACRRCASVAADIGADLLGLDPEVRGDDSGGVDLVWRFGAHTRVLLIGHLDTVWPTGTIDRWPFEVRGSVATGPGVFDMKLGVVQLLHAAARLRQLEGVAILLNTDEEIGSFRSRAHIQELSRGATAAFVFEPSADGALKTSRKGIARLDVICTGRASHAGLDPYLGANAVIELAHQVTQIAELDRAIGTATMTPTRIEGGRTDNTVPDLASVHIDVRFETDSALDEVRRGLGQFEHVVADTTVSHELSVARPPLPPSASAELYARAQRMGADLGVEIRGASVGGGSDGNLTAALGLPTLDGLGAVGGNAHAEGEWVDLDAIEPRVRLAIALIDDALSSSDS